MRIKVLLLILTGAQFLAADPIPPGTPACVAGSLTSYIALSPTGCFSGALVFKDFGFNDISGDPIGPTQIIVAPIAGLGLSFSTTITNSALGFLNYNTNYTEFDDPRVPIDGDSGEDATPQSTGGTSIRICPGAAFVANHCFVPEAVLNLASPGTPSGLAFFPPSGVIGIINTTHLEANGGTINSYFLQELFEPSSVPEPQTWTLTAFVVACALEIMRRRRKIIS